MRAISNVHAGRRFPTPDFNDDGSVQRKTNSVGTAKWTRRIVPEFVFFTIYPDFIDTL